jgi:hypothetical protein
MEKILASKIKKYSKFIFDLCLFLFFLVFFSIISSSTAQAANLYFLPSTGSYLIGDQFSVGIYVSSADQAINAASGTISFPPDKLEIISIPKNDSIITNWVQEPSFSNASGIINFEGIILNPGFIGAAGKILTVNFKAKLAGNASLDFSSGSVLANDGKGTDILNNLIGANFSLGFLGPSVPEGAPSAPRVISTTHPDSNKWYSNNDPQFKWEVSENIIGVKLLVDQKPISIPEVLYARSMSEKKLEDLADGIWYFHIQLQNKIGWGGISHFKFQIDTSLPKPFEVRVKEGTGTLDPQPILILEASDDVSGIDFYEVKIDDGSPEKTQEKEYKLPVQTFGKHNIIVKAVDKAGNYTIAMKGISISPIEAPVITNFPQNLRPGSILLIKGTAIKEAIVKIYIQKDKKDVIIRETESDAEGKWSYIEVEPVEKGIYEVWADVTDSKGAKSEPSPKITVLVSPPVFIRIGGLVIDYLTTTITLLVLIAVIIFGTIWGWNKIRRLRKETREAEKALYQAFKSLKEEVEKQVANLDGKPGLNEREKKLCYELKETLKESKKIVSKEIKDVEKELE